MLYSVALLVPMIPRNPLQQVPFNYRVPSRSLGLPSHGSHTREEHLTPNSRLTSSPSNVYILYLYFRYSKVFFLSFLKKYQILSKKANIENSHLILACLLGNSFISTGKQDQKSCPTKELIPCQERGHYQANDPLWLIGSIFLIFSSHVITRKRSQTKISKFIRECFAI